MLLKVFLMLISNPSLVCVMPAVCQPAWVGARPIVRMTVGARRRENSVAAHPPPLRPRLHRPAAGWPAPGVGGPVAGAPETGTEKGGERSQWEFLCLSELAEMSFSKTDLCFYLQRHWAGADAAFPPSCEGKRVHWSSATKISLTAAQLNALSSQRLQKWIEGWKYCLCISFFFYDGFVLPVACILLQLIKFAVHVLRLTLWLCSHTQFILRNLLVLRKASSLIYDIF